MSSPQRDLTSVALALFGGILASGCRAVREPTAPQDSRSPLVKASDLKTTEQAFRASDPSLAEGHEWLKFKSGEWLAGEVDSLDREKLQFDSETLDDLSLDWDDVVELITNRAFTLLLSDREALVGRVHLVDDRILVGSDDGVYEVPRDDVLRMIPGRPSESNYWSGRLRASATVRSGNTDQVDTAFSADITRRTAATRLDLAFDSVLGSLEGVESVDNQTFNGQYDIYLSSRLYLTLLGLELFRDPFQNIAHRATPHSGLGYTLVDRGKVEGTMGLALGYRATTFDSVAAGVDDSEETGTLIVSTDWDADITEKVELELSYSAQIGLEDVQDTNQDFSLLISTEFAWDFDFDIRIVWKRIGAPVADAGAEEPDKDDLRFELGLSWEF
jgi:hypothetical protein